MFLAPLLLAITLTPLGYVSDFANILKPETVTQVNTVLTNFEANTGNEIAVVTIPTLENTYTIESYATELFEKWGIGKEKEDNGVLLLISRDTRELRIEVGYGLEGELTDLESKIIIDEIITPAFRLGDYDKGVVEGVSAITQSIQSTSTPRSAGTGFMRFPLSLELLLVLLVVLSRSLGSSKSWWLGGIIGGVMGAILFYSYWAIPILALAGLIFDFILSRSYSQAKEKGSHPWWFGGGGGKGGGGGFGGFGGGMSGGGGASGRW